MRKILIHLLALPLLASAPTGASAAVLTVGPPGNTAGCSHPTLQAAIDAAAASPGLDIIRIVSGTYPAQHLFINDAGNLAIEGGFVACTTLVHYDYSTLDGQAANPAGPIIDHRGAGYLTLTDLHIQNSNATRAGSTLPLGGGVSSSGAGGLTIRRSTLFNNRATYGGGLYLGTPTPPKMVSLEGVTFTGNGATLSGGGIYAQISTLRITGDDVTSFDGNHADGTDVFEGGGALYATRSDVLVDARMPTNYPFMEHNWTAGSGGAIYFAVDSGAHQLSIEPRRGGGGAELAYNSASMIGGAINLEAVAAHAKAEAQLTDTILSHNKADLGAAAYLYAIGDSSYARLRMLAGEVCLPAWRCNRIDHNESRNGSTLRTELDNGGYTSLSIRRGYLVDNLVFLHGGLIDSLTAGGEVLVDNSLVVNNDVGNSALFGARGLTHVQNSTIANNMRVAPAVFGANDASAQLYVHNSIAFQPGVPLVQGAAGATVDLRNLLLPSTQPVGNEAPRNIQYTQDPLFANPAIGDYRLQAGSPARNRWSPGGGVDVPLVDLPGAARPAPGDTVTPYDFGAYEYGAVIDGIFAGGFETGGFAADTPRS